jgi:protoheme IX farnesyltransferase
VVHSLSPYPTATRFQPSYGARLRTSAELTKIRIVLLSSFSAAAGYLAFSRRLEIGVLAASLGTFFCAAGASLLNHYQDRDLDARMARTRNRPIPAGFVRPVTALAAGLILAAAGLGWLWMWAGATSAWIALGAVAWYNLLYAYLKRVWAFAAVPGAVVGALPPVIGWTAAGGSPWSPRILQLALFFFLWQVPHFWLLMFRHGQEYAQAGLPSISTIFPSCQLRRVTGAWILATGAGAIILPLFLPAFSPWIVAGLTLSGCWMVWEACRIVRPDAAAASYRNLFFKLNCFALAIIGLIAVNALL